MQTQKQANQVKGTIVARPATTVEPHRMYFVQFGANTDDRLVALMGGQLVTPTVILAGQKARVEMSAMTTKGEQALKLDFYKSELCELHLEFTDDQQQAQSVPLKFSQYPLVNFLGLVNDGKEYFGEVNFTDIPVARIFRKQFTPAIN